MSRCMCISFSLGIALLIALIGILLVFYAVIPAIVRSAIDKAQLDFRSVSIEEIENDRFRLRAELELSRTGSIPATILPPLIINVDQVGTVSNNRSIVIEGDSSKATLVPVDSPFLVTDLTGFHRFSRALIFESEVIWHLTAKASIQPISRHMPVYSNIPFNKQVKLTALNSLRRVTIQSIDLRRSNAEEISVDLLIEIFNPSFFTIDLGELRFSLQFDEQSIGVVQSATTNNTLRPHSNIIPFSGQLQSSSSQAYDALLRVIQNFLTGRTSDVQAVAGANATSYSLLAAGLENLALSVQMPAYEEKLISSLAFDSMSLIPSTNEKTALLSASILMRINSPLGEQSPLDIDLLNMSASLIFAGRSVGVLNVSQATVEPVGKNTYRARFNQALLVFMGTGESYESFAQSFIAADDDHPIEFVIRGSAAISGHFALGPLKIEGVPVDNSVSLGGLAGLHDVRVRGISIDGEEENSLQLSINVTIETPGVTDVQLQNFTLQMAESENGTILGQVPVSLLALRPGGNEMILHG